MYLEYDAPDYLIEDQPGESKVPCKPLIQKVKEDKSSVGLSGEQCMDEARMYFNEMIKKQEATARLKNDRKQKKLQKKIEKEKLMGDNMLILKDKNTIKLKD